MQRARFWGARATRGAVITYVVAILLMCVAEATARVLGA